MKERDTYVQPFPLGTLVDPTKSKKARLMDYYTIRTRGSSDRWDWTSDEQVAILVGYSSVRHLHRDRRSLIEQGRLLVEEVPDDQLRYRSGKLRYRINLEAEPRLSDEALAVWNQINSGGRYRYVHEVEVEEERPKKSNFIPRVYLAGERVLSALSDSPILAHWTELKALPARLPWLTAEGRDRKQFWQKRLRFATADNVALAGISDADLRGQVGLLGLAMWARRRCPDGMVNGAPVKVGLAVMALKDDITKPDWACQLPVAPL